ncbi:MAG: CvfB family protein [Verrucomicrobiales bacterium]|nr:S1-like domain-containing RNA-binding protein [Verrucomicrobiota bacterium JB025]
MARIGDRANLTVLREIRYGLVLDGGDLGEILLPRKEYPADWNVGGELDVFVYLDSEDRPVATPLQPKALPGTFARLKCVEVNNVGAFLDWGLSKELLVPFREQKTRMQPGRFYLVAVFVDSLSDRIVASTRLSRHLDQTAPDYQPGDPVDLMIYERTDLGYKAIINGAHSGLLFADKVYQPLQHGEKISGFIAAVRADGKIDLSLHQPGRAKVDSLEEEILAELKARGGYWNIGDHSPAAEIRSELGVSKRTFKQTIGSLFKKRLIDIGENGIRLAEHGSD